MRLLDSVRIAVFAAAGVIAVGCSTPLPPADTGQAVVLQDRPCPNDLVFPGRAFRCAVLTAPQDRARPAGPKVTIPIVVVKAASTSAKPPVLYLHGGPGGDIVGALGRLFSRDWARAQFTPDRDWVFFDQRGAGQSTPRLDCGELSLTDAGIANDADLSAFKACAQALSKTGVDFAHYNARAIVDDIQDLRTALGYSSFDLLGVSYGTRIAIAVAQYRPEGLRAMVLDSPYPPEAKGTQELPRITAQLTRHLLRATPGLADRFAARLSQWAQTPPRDFTNDDVGQFLVDTLYSRDGVANFTPAIKAILAGETGAITDYMKTRSGYDEAQNIAHFCKEELPFEDQDRMRAQAQGDPIALAVLGPALRYFRACQGLDVGAPEPREIEPYRGAIPALFLVAGADPGCPPEFNEPAARAMANAQIAVFPARTHGVARASPCAAAMQKAFLDDPLRPVDRTCLQDEPPPL